MNMQRAMEYAHQVGSIFSSLPRKALATQLRGMVRKLPPLMWAVKPSARSLSGNMAQREYSHMLSVKLSLVVRLIPKKREWTRLTIARTMPLSTTSRKKSIRKRKSFPPMVCSPSATK